MKALSNERISDGLTAYIKDPEYVTLVESQRDKPTGEFLLTMVALAFQAGARWRERQEAR